jgi:DNA polymerase-3 subunit gamma/tau
MRRQEAPPPCAPTPGGDPAAHLSLSERLSSRRSSLAPRSLPRSSSAAAGLPLGAATAPLAAAASSCLLLTPAGSGALPAAGGSSPAGPGGSGGRSSASTSMPSSSAAPSAARPPCRAAAAAPPPPRAAMRAPVAASRSCISRPRPVAGSRSHAPVRGDRLPGRATSAQQGRKTVASLEAGPAEHSTAC